MAHLIIVLGEDDDVSLDMKMTASQFVESISAIMCENEDFAGLIKASVEVYQKSQKTTQDDKL